MATKLSRLEIENRLFHGVARFIIFPNFDVDTIAKTTTVIDILNSGGVDLGRIIDGTPSWEGDDVTTETVKDTEGGAIITVTTAGTCAYGLSIPHSEEAAKRIGAREHTLTTATGSGFTIATDKKAIGINPTDLVGKRYPCAILNRTRNEIALFPKGNESFALGFGDKDILQYNVKAAADEIKTANLDTMMFIPLGGDPLAEEEEQNP